MTNLKRAIIATLLGAFITLSPLASAAGDFDRAGVYVGVNGVYGMSLFDSEVEKFLGPVNSTGTGGVNARLGFRLLSFISLEAQYEWLDNLQVEQPAAPNIKLNITAHNVTGNAKLYIPVWRIQPYALAGFGWNQYDVKATVGGADAGTTSLNSFAGRFGGGADFYLTKHVALNAEVAALLTVNDFNFNQASVSSLHYLSVSAGLLYRF